VRLGGLLGAMLLYAYRPDIMGFGRMLEGPKRTVA
jgi:hypothetical protein